MAAPNSTVVPVHQNMARKEAEAALHQHGLAVGAHLLRFKKAQTYVLSMCMSLDPAKVQIGHFILGAGANGFLLDGKQLSQRCTTLDEVLCRTLMRSRTCPTPLLPTCPHWLCGCAGAHHRCTASS